jgi:hypothetical protein
MICDMVWCSDLGGFGIRIRDVRRVFSMSALAVVSIGSLPDSVQ